MKKMTLKNRMLRIFVNNIGRIEHSGNFDELKFGRNSRVIFTSS